MKQYLVAPALVIAFSSACSTNSKSPVPRPAVSTEEACVDRWLADGGLDRFGYPQGSVYAGGTPLFDEATGKQRDRLDLIYSRHPDIRKACSKAQ